MYSTIADKKIEKYKEVIVTVNEHYIQGTPLFTKINKVPKQYPYLTEDKEAEIVIIGGGITGGIAAYYFAQKGVKCIIVEKSRIGFGSTSAATSLIQYELDSKARQLEEYIALSDIMKVYKLDLGALQDIDQIIAAHGNACGYEKKGTLLYTDKGEKVCEIEEEYRLRKQEGLRVELIKEENNPYPFALKAGVYDPNGGAQFDPYLFTHELLENSKGVEVYENTEVVGLEYLNDKIKVETSYGNSITAGKVILATGYDTNKFTTRSFGTKTVSYNIATYPLEDMEVLKQIPIIRDSNEPYFYYRTTADGRLIAGGCDMPFNPNIFNEKLAQEKYEILENRLRQMFPHIKNMEIEYKYCGCFASTTDNLGFIGKDPEHENLWYLLGYGADGILFDILGAKMLTKLYEGEEDPNMQLFIPTRFDK